MVYLDDILVLSKTQPQLSQHLGLVLEKQREESLYAYLFKCTFGAGSVKHLGYGLSSDGASVDPQLV